MKKAQPKLRLSIHAGECGSAVESHCSSEDPAAAQDENF
jgi:hypothetical protein